jgi:hypothetical protein
MKPQLPGVSNGFILEEYGLLKLGIVEFGDAPITLGWLLSDGPLDGLELFPIVCGTRYGTVTVSAEDFFELERK